MATPIVVATEVGIAKKRVFNLDTFEKVTLEAKYEVPKPVTSVDEVIGMEETKLLSIVNEGLKRYAWKEARATISGASPKVVNQMVNVFRMLPPYTDIKGADGEVDRQKQTQSIYAFIRSNESILNSLKEAAARSVDVDDEDEDEEAK